MLLPFAMLSAVVLTAAETPQQVRVVTSDVTVAGGRGGGGAAGLAGGPPMAVGTSVIFGKIVEAETSNPVPGAIVTIALPGAQPIRVMADGQGRFGFRDLPKGRFNITATRPGWADGAYGRTRPSGPAQQITLADGERVSNVNVSLWRFASITGRVVDESGDPLVSMPVRVLKRTTVGGKMKLNMVTQDATDDRGVYRVGSLEPGDYVVAVPLQNNSSGDVPFAAAEGAMREVMAVRAVAVAAGSDGPVMLNGIMGGSGPSAGVGPDGRPLAFATMFYPNVTTSARAQLLTLTSGEERSAVDFQMRPVPISKVSGVASGPDGPIANLQIALVPAEADEAASSLEVINGFSDEQGRFTIEGVPPGQYVLRATRTPRAAMGPGEFTSLSQNGQVMAVRVISSSGTAAPLPTDPTLWAEMSVNVGNKDVTDLAVGLRPGIKMAGMVRFDGGAEKPAPDQLGSIMVTLEPADSRPGVSNARGRVDQNGSFATVGVPPGRYFLRVNGAFQNWSFQSAMVGGRDASVEPVEFTSADLNGVTIVFTDRATELSGQVTGDGALDSLSVLVFPADSAAWTGYGNSSRRFATTRVDKQGNYKLSNLPAGQYLAVALPDKLINDWQNPKFLESLVPSGARVVIRDNEKVTAGLRVAR
ncbi:MAG TPA: carboxypeptidase-like regulatory domain-containing protein [Vicinamibacterales bacterium]|nr:carboxypeptidase-like regulatory domain-containing protein [Vicinamibacterales bacterium]